MTKPSLKRAMLFCIAMITIIDASAQQPSDTALKKILTANIARLPIKSGDITDAIINSSYEDKSTGIRYIYLQQGYRSIGVFNQIISIALRNNQVLHVSGRFIPNLASKVPASIPAITAVHAIQNTAKHLQLPLSAAPRLKTNAVAADSRTTFEPLNIAKRDIETKLVWVRDDLDSTKIHLAWNVSIDIAGSNDWWNVRIDAFSGEYINKNNYTVHERRNTAADDDNDNNNSQLKQPIAFVPAGYKPAAVITPAAAAAFFQPPVTSSANYRVIPFPNENPYTASAALLNNPWEKAGTGNNATTYGWQYDGTNYDSTRGNNVHAYLDSANFDADDRPNFSAVSTTAQPTLTFDFNPNFTAEPIALLNQDAALTNLFYWNNIMHDITYQYGFNEVSGNFQATNIFNGTDRGGAGGDYVFAEAQDGSGVDNSNFNSPPDGLSGRMQMYLFDGVASLNVSVAGPPVSNYTSAAVEGAFSLNNRLFKRGSITGQAAWYTDAAASNNGCATSTTTPVAGKIAIITRGSCNYTVKVKNAQNAGAIGVVVINNVAGSAVTMGGTDASITIPAIMISQADGATLSSAMSSSTVTLQLATTTARDGDFDNGVICHEYTHGISNRLTGGPSNASCLANAEQGGEGWSDYVALMVTTDWTTAQTTDGANLRPLGNYAESFAANGPGIRTYPYTTNMTVNPHTYADLAAVSQEVHYIGEVWCSAIWDMTWNIIQQENKIAANIYDTSGANASGGNVIALKLVLEGMRLQTCSPGFLDSRDAILAADSILYGFRHKCSIWNAFARRGMGLSAVQGSSYLATDQVAAFDVPSSYALIHSLAPAIVESGKNITVKLTASCQCQFPVQGNFNDTIPSGFSFVSSDGGGTLNGNIYSIPLNNFFTASNQTKRISIVMSAAGTGCDTASAINDNRDANTLGGLASAAANGVSQWTTSNTRSHSAPNAWHAPDISATTDFSLASAPFTVGPLSVLSFWHYFVTDATFDGGRVEYSTDGGGSWLDAAPFIVQNGYNTTMIDIPWGNGAQTFSGVSFGQDGNSFINTLVDFSSFAGQSLRVRFHMQTDEVNDGAYDGWFIDDIKLMNGCGTIAPAGLYNNSNALVDAARLPVFLIPAAALPLSLLSFTAKPAGADVLLNWQTATEINTSKFEIEHSTDGRAWSNAGTVAAQGSGNGTYLFYDQQPAEGINYYRIKMIDKDGQFTYTSVRTVVFSGKDNAGFTIVPNPAHAVATIYLNKNISSGKLTVYDAYGRAVQQLMINNAGNGYQLQTSKLAAGSYVISVTNGTTTAVGKLVVAH